MKFILTTESSYEEIEQALREDFFPKQPRKPTIASLSGENPVDFRKYADELEAYHRDMEEYKTKVQGYTVLRDRITEIWMQKLRKEYRHLNDATFNLIYAEAYERGHSCGYSEVRSYLDDYDTLATNIINANR